MSDASPTAARERDAGIRRLFLREPTWQFWLDVEAALARAEADVGIVPVHAAATIAAVARADLIDRGRIEEASRRTGHSLVPVIWELARLAGDAGGWVHWGATSQNILQTAEILRLRSAHTILLDLLADIIDAMSELAERGAEMTMAGRTHGQHAIPTTFGYKVAAWIDELGRHVERLQAARSRVFVAFLGGAAGTFASLGPQGPDVQARLATHLDLQPMAVPARSIADHLAEYVALLGLLASTCGKVGREIATLMSTEYGEVEEPIPAGTVGSSTMPQKRNPRLGHIIVSQAASVRSMVPLALEAMQTQHEADRGLALMMQQAVQTSCVSAGDMLSALAVSVSGLQLFPERMLANLERTGGLIMAEPVMMRLGRSLGRQLAHDVVYAAAQQAAESGRTFHSVLSEDPRVSEHLSPETLTELLDPRGYTGLAAELTHQAAARGRLIVAQLRATPRKDTR